MKKSAALPVPTPGFGERFKLNLKYQDLFMVRMCFQTKNHHCFGVMNYDATNQGFGVILF
jgi:hypothetical protein